MDSGWAVVLGGSIGVIGTLGTTWLNHYYAETKKDKAEGTAKALLTEMLGAPQWKWRTIHTLANVVGTDEATVRRLLLEIGARGSMNDPGYWGLVSRNPFANAAADKVEREPFREVQIIENFDERRVGSAKNRDDDFPGGGSDIIA